MPEHRTRHPGLERALTARFTLVVGALLVVGIAVYGVTDSLVSRARVDAGLQQRAFRAGARLDAGRGEAGGEVRVLAADGTVLSAGELLSEMPPGVPAPGFSTASGPDGALRVVTVRLADGRWMQMAERSAGDSEDLAEKLAVLAAVAVFVSVATYFIGLRFARQAMLPVRETLGRLDQFTGDAGHEIRTPLASARASLELAARTGDHSRGIAHAIVEIDRASALADRLLEMARLDELTLATTATSIDAAVTRCFASVAARAGARGVTLEREGQDARIEADPVLFERLVTNLLDNAVRFADPGTTVTVAWTPTEVRVHDHGATIPAGAMDRVFDPFYQADPSRADEGFGLGLAIARRIALLHGWELDGRSDERDGTTFVITLPHGGRQPARPGARP